ncbi:MAG: hypothetical protein IAE97_00725 [Chthoniobacterales bacterium]|nr:hypothetical protein [Chthoniobacterales bacterium]
MNSTHLARNPFVLIVLGVVATGYGIHLILRGLQGDTLLSGTTFTYLPRWLFILTGLILQLPLPGAVWFLIATGYLKVG